MKTFAAALILLVCAGAASAETRSVAPENFDAIVASGQFSMEIVAGSAPSVSLEGSPSDLDHIRARFVRGVLRVEDDCTFNCGNRPRAVTVRVIAPAGLERLNFSKGTQVSVAGLNSRDLRIDVSMGAVVELAGRCEEARIDASMGGVISAEALTCRRADVSASMGGVARIRASEAADADATMGGEISIAGAPESRRAREFMGGSVSIQ